MANATRKGKPKKPAKPYEQFPLTAHASGRWCKKVAGRIHYFGRWGRVVNGEMTTVDNPEESTQAALNEYLDIRDDLHAGRTPRPKVDGVSVADICNEFLSAKQDRLDSGELTAHSFRDYFDVCKLIAEFFGRNRNVSDLKAIDFSKFRAWLSSKHGVHRLAKDIRVARMVFQYAYEMELIDKPIRVGPNFKEPNKKSKRKANREAGKKHFSEDEICKLLDATSQPLKAMILLGINCGFGNSDIASLPRSAVDLEGGWIDFPRPKTEINRRCPLWPETVEALREAAEHRGEPKNEADADCVFITKIGHRFVRTNENESPEKRTRIDSIGPAFKRMMVSLDIDGRRSFYGLRHSFETVAGESKDQVAVDAIMGHVDPSMASNYRHSISDERLRAVVDVVHDWLLTFSPEIVPLLVRESIQVKPL
jgi:integrase